MRKGEREIEVANVEKVVVGESMGAMNEGRGLVG